MIKLASFVDVRKVVGAANVEPVIIKIGKYSLQYNQAKDYNIGAGFPNLVTIATDVDATGVNWIQSELGPENQQFTFSESGKTVFVNYCAAVTGTSNTPDAVYVGIGVGRSACTTIPADPSPTAPAPAPTKQPTKAPTKLPTISPTKQPSKAPVPAPVAVPVPAPVQPPVAVPAPLPTFWPTIPPTPSPVVADSPEIPDQVPEEGDEDEDDMLECLDNANSRVRFTLDDTPDGEVEVSRCRNVISYYGSAVCSFTALRRRNNGAWPDDRQIKDICQEECALAGNGMCDPVGDSSENAAPLICENKPKRVVRYTDNQGGKQKIRCADVNADLCIRDALSKDFEPIGFKIYDMCQHQCADHAQCDAI
jgi:hypothetical protein